RRGEIERRRIARRIGREHHRSGSSVRINDGGFDAKAADEVAIADAIVVGLDVALIPGETEGRRRNLNDEEIEICVRRQTGGPHMQILGSAIPLMMTCAFAFGRQEAAPAETGISKANGFANAGEEAANTAEETSRLAQSDAY